MILLKNSIFYFLIFFFFVFSAPLVFSQSPSPSISTASAQISVNPKSEYNKRYTDKLFNWLSNLHLATCLVVGEKCIPDEARERGAKLPAALKISEDYNLFKNGLVGVVTNLYTVPYANPPASLSFYLDKKISDFFGGDKVYAQSTGLGITSLSSYFSFWSISRNIAYSLIIVILLIAGFLHIFQFKIDPNISIDIEKIILNVVLVVLTVTFSFAIAGFLIDLMYLLLMVIFHIARTNNLISAELVESLYGHVSAGEIFDFLTLQTNPIAFVNNFLQIIPDSVRNLAKAHMTGVLAFQLFPNVTSALHDIYTFIETQFGLLGSGVEFDPGAIAAGVSGMVVSPLIASIMVNYLERMVILLAIYFTLLFLYFRILFILIGSYIEIVFGVVFAPFLLLADIFTGKNRFARWLTRMLANVIAFPLLAVLFLAGANITNAVSSTSNAFLPPPLTGMGKAILSSLVGIGVLLAIPSIIDRVKKSIIPDYTLVNFPTTPASILGAVASIIPFLPTITHAWGAASQGAGSTVSRIFRKQGLAEKPPLEPPPTPHIPGSGGEEI